VFVVCLVSASQNRKRKFWLPKIILKWGKTKHQDNEDEPSGLATTANNNNSNNSNNHNLIANL
jgi:hypothetical protein